jgi:hypothetical protein
MRLSDRQPQTIRSRRSENQVNMIGHETVGPHVDSGLARLISQKIPTDLLVAVLKKDRLSTISALRNMMGRADTTVRANRAMGKTNTNVGIGDRYHVPLSLPLLPLFQGQPKSTRMSPDRHCPCTHKLLLSLCP